VDTLYPEALQLEERKIKNVPGSAAGPHSHPGRLLWPLRVPPAGGAVLGRQPNRPRRAVLPLRPAARLATLVASRAFFAPFALALITLAVTLVLGRHVCGWLCPLGAMLQFFSFAFKRMRWHKPRLEGCRGLGWKYLVLLLVLAGSLFTLNLVGLLDPLSFLYRSFGVAVLPSLVVVANAGTTRMSESGMSTLAIPPPGSSKA